ncbi:acyl-CoA dehydrogenase family protein [Mycolicibacterium monacense]|uniref:Dibenzothiophene monooxygenase n=4 Tax=Mycobacteriaceae TaxID=1762 RepID=A0AAD1MXG2_MYCMB|nr:acyl-CoA dehydrogenase family protein [Mycolicibacterium monacense]MDA4102384.1 acyl-CoA dehydrogenase [Mycolicibacterium monacense DSM 44395]OBB70686.1 acyl-CoA dehydrogenase [Mycolicibacterium monacense]ORB19125.1 acyl-CoA dehydrogenase [Mycolicibacterium monacense DSM 44395]QHP87106.1 acyl-CoA dehydrogenase [Mycolicibacterium monacense DSM 44395]BBZ59799.1 acyl-CoA dehydrogenase [Mycolicibacterium monacense]
MTITPETTAPTLVSVDQTLAVARRVAAEIAVGAVDREVRGVWPEAELRRVAESGLLGIIVPERFGGPDLPRSTAVEVLRILSEADSAVGQLLLAHFVLNAAIGGLGDTEPAPTIYRDVVAGAQLGNATVERGTRLSVDRLTTVTRRPGGGWVLDGTKYYATGTLGASWIAVAARIADTEPAHGATVFVRPTDPGVTLNLDRWSSFGQRGTASGEVVFDRVAVDDPYVIDEGPDPDPVTSPPSVLGAFDQALHAAVDIGIARAALTDGARFVTTKSRPWFEAGVDSAADEPHVVRRFGELTARLYALEALLAAGTARIDEALTEPELTRESAAAASLQVAAAKALAQEFAVEIASGVFELAGASATDRGYALDRHWRNVRVHSLHDPARWKYVHLGNHTLRGTLPPRLGVLL